MTKVHEDQFKLIKGKDQLGLYQWNTHVAKHYFCKNCDIYTFHRKCVTPKFLGVNIYCLDNAEYKTITIIEVGGISMPKESME